MQELSGTPAKLLPDQGCAGLGGWVTAAAPTAACIWQHALEGTIKKRFALQLESLIKICRHVNGKGKKGSIQSSLFPLTFLLNFQVIPPAPTVLWGSPVSLLVSPHQGWLCWGQHGWCDQ